MTTTDWLILILLALVLGAILFRFHERLKRLENQVDSNHHYAVAQAHKATQGFDALGLTWELGTRTHSGWKKLSKKALAKSKEFEGDQ